MFRNLHEMKQALDEQFVLDRGQVIAIPEGKPNPAAVDALARNAVFNPDPTLRAHLRRCLRSAATCRGVSSRSIQSTVEVQARRPQGVVLAVRLGGHCYDLMRLVMRSARQQGVGAVVFEQGWTGQSPWEFSALLSAAALREQWPTPLFMRCCLPPMASDLLPGGQDLDALEERLALSAGADFHNLVLRVSPAAMLRERSRKELCRLLRQARQEGMAVSLRVEEPGSEDSEELLRALSIATEEVHPLLLALSPGCRSWPAERLRDWVHHAHAQGVSLSGPKSPSLLELPPHRPVLECRVDFQWAQRIVMGQEFSKELRKEVLSWLRSAAPRGPYVDDSTLLDRHEFQALGHLDFHMWDLEELPRFRQDVQDELAHLFQVLQVDGAAIHQPQRPEQLPVQPHPPLADWNTESPGLL